MTYIVKNGRRKHNRSTESNEEYKERINKIMEIIDKSLYPYLFKHIECVTEPRCYSGCLECNSPCLCRRNPCEHYFEKHRSFSKEDLQKREKELRDDTIEIWNDRMEFIPSGRGRGGLMLNPKKGNGWVKY